MTTMFPESNTQSFANRLWYTMVVMLVLTFAMILLAIYTLVVRNDDRNIILDRLSDQVKTGQKQATANQKSRQASSCTNYRNQRALEEAVRDIGRLNEILVGEPRVLASKATVADCNAAGTPIGEDGMPEIEPAVPVGP